MRRYASSRRTVAYAQVCKFAQARGWSSDHAWGSRTSKAVQPVIQGRGVRAGPIF